MALSTNFAVEWGCIQKFTGSNLGPTTTYNNWGVRWCSTVSANKCRTMKTTPQPLPSK